MHLLLVTDAWLPQVNGVVRTMSRLVDLLQASGHQVTICHPGLFTNFPCPTYPEIRLALPFGLKRMLSALHVDHIHIVTEGPIGLAAKRYCDKQLLRYTSSFHTRFPEYLRDRLIAPLNLTYRYLRWFHDRAAATLVPTASMQQRLTGRGFTTTRLWTRGVDHSLFHQQYDQVFADLPKPIFLNVGRVALEKNLSSFLSLDLPGSKVLVGDGPELSKYQKKYPDVIYTGYKQGEALAACFASADVFVFPSCTDTFGLVMLEAMACGLPVAAFNVTGPCDVVTTDTGVLVDPKQSLRDACLQCLALNRADSIAYAKTFTWEKCATIFLDTLVPCCN